jgi:U3 small nucleolar RNA-associated protein 14
VPSTSSGPSRKKNTLSSSTEAKAVRGLKKAAGRATAQEREDEDERVEIDVTGAELGGGQKRKGKEKAGKEKLGSNGVNEDGEGESEQGEDELMPVNSQGVRAFTQRDLVAEAFAGDSVVEVSSLPSMTMALGLSAALTLRQDFAKEKARQVEADAPKVEDTSLPGWVSPASWLPSPLLLRYLTCVEYLAHAE